MKATILATGFAAAAVLGAAGLASTTTATGIRATDQVQPVVFDVPLPRDPAPAPAALPTAEELTGILENLADPAAPYKDKTILVQGGINAQEGHRLDHLLRHAQHNGELPLTFTVANIAPAGADSASADVTVAGPKLPAPVTKNVTFANQNGWMVSYESAQELLEEAITPAH